MFASHGISTCVGYWKENLAIFLKSFGLLTRQLNGGDCLAAVHFKTFNIDLFYFYELPGHLQRMWSCQWKRGTFLLLKLIITLFSHFDTPLRHGILIQCFSHTWTKSYGTTILQKESPRHNFFVLIFWRSLNFVLVFFYTWGHCKGYIKILEIYIIVLWQKIPIYCS